MNIAFDAKRVFTNGTGLGHYSRTLVSSLCEYFPMHEYFLCSPKITNRFDASVYDNLHVVTPQHFPSSFLTAAWRSSWVKNDLEQMNIDIYHGLSHEIPVGISQKKIKIVVTIHDLIFERYPQQYSWIDVMIYRKKFKYACNYADRIIAISEQTKNDIIEFYKIDESKIDVCYQSCNAAFNEVVSDVEKKKIKDLYNLPENFFLYVGSLIERKNLLTICKALKVLKNKIFYPLVVIGDGGSYKKLVKKYIAENDLTENIIFLSEMDYAKNNDNFKTAKDFPAIYSQAICMIYPSTFEGFGIPVLESLCAGTPVITSNISSLPEAGGDAAFYINPLNENQLAEVMKLIAQNVSLRKELIAKGFRHAANFSREKCAMKVMKVYEQLKATDES